MERSGNDINDVDLERLYDVSARISGELTIYTLW
jgi:hypothetical protein